MADAPRDDNNIPSALWVSSVDWITTVPLKVNPVTWRVLVDLAWSSWDVTWPWSSTDEAIARYDGTTGKVLQNSNVTINDAWTVNIPSWETYNINGTPLGKWDIWLWNVDNTSDSTKNSASVTLTNKTINLTDNTISWTLSQFNTALSDATFATGWWTVTGSSSWTNTWDQTSIVWITWTKSEYDTSCSDGNFVYDGDNVSDLTNDAWYITDSSTDTLTNKNIDANWTWNSISNIDVVDLANGTDWELITWDASWVATTVAVWTANQVLTSNWAWAAPTFQDAGWGGNKTIFLQASSWQNDASISYVWMSPAVNMADWVTDNVRLWMTVPDWWMTISSVKLHASTNATSWNAYLLFESQTTASGTSVNTWTSTDSIAVTTYATNATTQWLEIIDITAALNGLTLTAGYNLGIHIQRQWWDASDTLWTSYLVYGVEIVYS